MEEEEKAKKVIICVPTVWKPYQVTLDSIEASIPLIQEAGWDDGMVSVVGCPYISHARSTMLWKALRADADVIVFIDHDLSWKPEDLLTLINTEGDVAAGTYRFKNDTGKYMGLCLPHLDGSPQVRDDGAIRAHCVPAGFLKITKDCVNKFIKHFPELCYGDKFSPKVDLFNHGVHEGIWYGEDYSFCRRWLEVGGDIALVPDLDISHWRDDKEYKGNFHTYLQKQPGGAQDGSKG